MISRRQALTASALMCAGAGLIAAQPAMAQGDPAAAPEPAAAQEPQASADFSIVVTANKREQALEAVPASLQAFDAETLSATGIADLGDLQYLTPGLSITPFQSESQLFIRGIGNNVNAPGLDPSNAVHLNNIYLSRPALALVDFYDVERVEVLKGPQGTLYGRNATGGAVNIITAAPKDSFDASGSIGYGSFNAVRAEGMVNVPFSAGAVRLAGLYSVDDGYTDNLFAGGNRLDRTDVLALRGRVRFDLGPAWTVEAGVDYLRDRGNTGLALRNVPEFGGPYIGFPGNATGARDYNLDGDVTGDQDALLGDVQITWQGDNLTFRSITGYLDYAIAQNVDTDGTANPLEQLLQATDTRTFTQEFQLASATGSQFQWIIGAFYLDERTDHASVFELAFDLGLDREALFDDVTATSTRSWAVFAEGTYDFGGGFSATVGARYTKEDKDAAILDNLFGKASSTAQSFDAFTPRLILAYTPTARSTLYASVARGFKSGGTSGLGGALNAFDEETVTAYEAGYRAVFADGRARLNAAIFYNDYEGAQIFALDDTDVGAFVTIPVNIPQSRTAGFEFDGELAVTDSFSVRAGYTYLDTEIESDIFLPSGLAGRGLPLPNASRHQFFVGADLTTDLGDAGAIKWTLDYAWQDEFLAPVFQNPVTETLPGYGLLNAGIRWESRSGGLFASLVGRNLANETFPVYRADFTDFAAVLEYNGAPRMIMATIGFRR